MLLGCVILKVYFLRGSSKAYSLYKVYITLHFTVPDEKVQLYAYDNLFWHSVRSKQEKMALLAISPPLVKLPLLQFEA